MNGGIYHLSKNKLLLRSYIGSKNLYFPMSHKTGYFHFHFYHIFKIHVYEIFLSEWKSIPPLKKRRERHDTTDKNEATEIFCVCITAFRVCRTWKSVSQIMSEDIQWQCDDRSNWNRTNQTSKKLIFLRFASYVVRFSSIVLLNSFWFLEKETHMSICDTQALITDILSENVISPTEI